MLKCCRTSSWRRSTKQRARLTHRCNPRLGACLADSAFLASDASLLCQTCRIEFTERFMESLQPAGRSGGANVVGICFLAVPAFAQNDQSHNEASLTMQATGPFDVTVTPQDDKSEDPLLNRMLLDKQYHGDLEGTGKGQMLTAGTAVKGSGAYVA